MQKSLKGTTGLSVVALLLAVFMIFTTTACSGNTMAFTTGGVLLGNNSSSANGVDSGDLTLEAVEPAKGVDYAGKITGSTKEVSATTYKHWFGSTAYTEATKEGAKGALLINLMLVLDNSVLGSDVVNLNLHAQKTDEFDKTVAFSEAKDGDNFVYMIFPVGKRIEFQVAYGKDADNLKRITYSFDTSAVTKKAAE